MTGGELTVNSSVNSVILIVFAFSDNLSAENSNCLRSSATAKTAVLDVWCQGTARWQFRSMNLPIKCFRPTHKDAERGFDHLTLETP